MKYTISATIPTVQYGNLQPSIEVEADSFEEARALVMPEIQSVWNSVCEEGKELVIKGTPLVVGQKPDKVVKPDLGDVALFMDDNHVYKDDKGEVYQSGSVFAGKFGYEFDKTKILPLYASKVGETPETIDDYWNTKGKLSTDVGTAIHQALETYGKFNKLATKLEKPLGIHPLLLPAVQAFYENREDEEAMYEPLISSKKLKRCGRIDRLVITDKENKKCIIQDFKTNIDLHKQGSPKFLKAPYDKDGFALPNTPVGEYTIQLNFYRTILEELGWTVESMELHHLEDKWSVIEVEKVEI